MGDLLVRAEPDEDMEALVRQLWSIIACTGGWVGRFDEHDDLDEQEVRLVTYRASRAELTAILREVRAGRAASEAWAGVQGPSYRYRQWFRQASDYWHARIDLAERLLRSSSGAEESRAGANEQVAAWVFSAAMDLAEAARDPAAVPFAELRRILWKRPDWRSELHPRRSSTEDRQDFELFWEALRRLLAVLPDGNGSSHPADPPDTDSQDPA